jgi:hypothetical protein
MKGEREATRLSTTMQYSPYLSIRANQRKATTIFVSPPIPGIPSQCLVSRNTRHIWPVFRPKRAVTSEKTKKARFMEHVPWEPSYWLRRLCDSLVRRLNESPNLFFAAFSRLPGAERHGTLTGKSKGDEVGGL